MSVLMVGVGRLVGHLNREKCNDGGNQIESGVGCLGKDSQATGCNAYDYFESSDGHCGQHGMTRDRTLFRAHGAWTVDGRRCRHTCIISVRWFAAKLLPWAVLTASHLTPSKLREIRCKSSFAPLCARIFLTLFELTWRNHRYDPSLSGMSAAWRPGLGTGGKPNLFSAASSIPKPRATVQCCASQTGHGREARGSLEHSSG